MLQALSLVNSLIRLLRSFSVRLSGPPIDVAFVSHVFSLHARSRNELPQVRHRRSTFSILWLLLLVCIETNSINAQSNQQIPQQNTDALSIEEVRWCKNEVYRLAGEAKEVDQNDYWEIHDYNLHVKRYRSLCLNRSSPPNSANRVTKELTAVAKEGIRDAGIRRFAFGRINRNENRVYVTSMQTRVFESSHPNALQVGDLRKWEEAFLLGKSRAERVEIEWLMGTQPTRKTGWIAASSYSRGNGRQVREAYCRANKGAPVGAGELLHGTLSRARFMLLQVRNSTAQDAYVKLLDPGKKVAVSFLVKARANRTINGLPKGEYEIAFATGSEFSRGCGSFVKRGFSGWVSQPVVFDDHSYEWAISLQTPEREITVHDTRAYAEFDAL